MQRLIQRYIERDLKQKLVFLTGPRQVGKTWLAKQITSKIPGSVYLNYDSASDQKIIQNETWLPDTPLLVLDELHKMSDFKNYLKGIYDTKQPECSILVTGSARLDTFRQAGDSMAGRFYRHRLLPLSLAELSHDMQLCSLPRFLERGGFPEPFLSESIDDSNRWRMQYLDGLIRNDILDFENVHDLKSMQSIFELLRHRVGSPISYSALARDVGISPNTVKRYIEIFESLFIVFRVAPYSKKIRRSILKEPKFYFYDVGLVKGDDSIKLENFVAVSLLKSTYTTTDLKGILHQLFYMRTKDGYEVDFLLTVDEKPDHLIEVEFSDHKISPYLKKFKKLLNVKTSQLVMHLKQEYVVDDIFVIRAEKFLKNLNY